MKKLVSCILALALLVTAAAFTATAAGAEENLCAKFDTVVGDIYYKYKNLSEMNAYSMSYYVAGQYVRNEKDYTFYERDFTKNGEYYASGDDGCYIKVDADKFDATVKKCFNFKGDFRKEYIDFLNNSEVYNGIRVANGEYIESDNTYIMFWSYRAGSEIDYTFAGYAKVDGGYKAYIKGVNEDGSDRTADQDPYYVVFDIEYSGSYIKINDFKTVKAVMPTVDGLITYPDVLYDLPAGVTIEADGCFKEGTEVCVSAYDDPVAENNAKKALKAVVGDGKVVAFHIDAYNRLSWYGDAIQPTKPVKITFDIPEGLAAKNLKLFYIPDEGSPEEVQITVDEQNNKVTAVFKHFSTYAFCNVEGDAMVYEPDETGKTQNNAAAKSPKTGDNSNVVFAAMLVLLSAAGATVVLLKNGKKAF